MSLSEKFIVLPFKKNRGNIVPGEMRQASSAASAEKIATAMSARHLGVAAYSIQVDEESGDMPSPKLIIAFGETADLTRSDVSGLLLVVFDSKDSGRDFLSQLG